MLAVLGSNPLVFLVAIPILMLLLWGANKLMGANDMKTNDTTETTGRKSCTELVKKLNYCIGLLLMTLFGIGTSWASGISPILHRPVAAWKNPLRRVFLSYG
ncbi:hypothetical protein ASF69_01510 [Rhizobium sp. Leaf311]|nr:hypothetical protein ASF69_01510 [Rhizobium sp. Leaf311]